MRRRRKRKPYPPSSPRCPEGRLRRQRSLARFGKLSIDGTKVRANASKRKAMSYRRMGEEARRVEGEVEALLNRARDTDAEEDARFGESLRGGRCTRAPARMEAPPQGREAVQACLRGA